MNRRSLLSAGVFALGGNQILPARGQGDAPKPLPPAARYTLSLNRNWLYGGRAAAENPAGVDDRKLERVTLPHANIRLPWHSFDDQAFQFCSLYRRHFRIPPALQGRRIFVDFGGVMTAATVSLNGGKLGSHLGGYTPFSFELTGHLHWDADNVLAVEVDSTERKDIPPFGNVIDYLTFGGIYREVSVRAVSDTFIENVFARPLDALSDNRQLRVRCSLDSPVTHRAQTYTVEALLRDGAKTLATAGRKVTPAEDPSPTLELRGLGSIELWDVHHPKLYEVLVRLHDGDKVVDEYTTRIGFREALFTPEGFRLNGKVLKLRGLNRHQTYPYVGGAMPARIERRDAQILRNDLKCNVVRTSHYPQSPHFLDACDEAGLLVFEEIPGWQHIGDKAWQELAVRNVGDMIRRDWNHPSIVLWGVRINESQDNHEFYTRTNALAHRLDDSRQTGGVRNFMGSELIEDVFTSNDFGFPLKPPNHPLYLNTEFSGHMFSTKSWDTVEHVAEHVVRHARVHNQLASNPQYAGGLGWCAFDYNTHGNFGSGDRICYHGVSDIFRIPKPAAQFYRSQCDPEEEIVLEPCFHWSQGDQPEAGGVRRAIIASNCDHLKIYLGGKLRWEVDPDRGNFGNLPHPLFVADLSGVRLEEWADLRIDGYLQGKKVASRTLPGNDADRELHVEPDDWELVGDGIDMTRVVLRVTNEHGGRRPFATGAISLSIEGPGEIVGENPFALAGGVGAVWVKTKAAGGVIRLHARHPYLGTRTVSIQVKSASAELL